MLRIILQDIATQERMAEGRVRDIIFHHRLMPVNGQPETLLSHLPADSFCDFAEVSRVDVRHDNIVSDEGIYGNQSCRIVLKVILQWIGVGR